MKAPTKDIKIAYEAIKKEKGKFGVFEKACFHIHTPASHDYQLTKEWPKGKYASATVEEVYQICIDRNVLPESIKLDEISLSGDLNIFKSKKEFLAYVLLANSLIKNRIEIAVVTDHNTIDGVDKLRLAVKKLKEFKDGVYPEILLGIEISCADKNHIVGIFNDERTIRRDVQIWLEENLIDVTDGTIKSSLDALDFIHSHGGFGYIAHINSSPMFNKGAVSGAYKTKLLSRQRVVGVSGLDTVESVKRRTKDFVTTEPNFVLDNDAHTIEELDEKCFWIKGSKKDFATTKEALCDYDISVSLTSVPQPDSYIEGIYIENTEQGFLSGQNGTAFCLKFSPALNCLIGGRGTGKSSVLEILEYALSQRCLTKEKLNFICAHGNVYILYQYAGDEFIIILRTPTKDPNDDILRCFGQNLSDKYGYRYQFIPFDIREYTLNNYISVYKIVPQRKTWKIENVPSKREILRLLFDTRYSVNELVNTAGGENITQFIYDTMFENQTLSNPSGVVRARRKSGLIKMLENTVSALDQRKEKVLSVIDPFNACQNNILRIQYFQTNDYDEPPVFKWLFGSQNHRKWYRNKNLSFEAVEQFLLSLYSKVGLWKFLNIIVSVDVNAVKAQENILQYRTDLTKRMIEEGISELKIAEADGIIGDILRQAITNNNISDVIIYIKEYVSNTERFVLEFNINNKEGAKLPVLYRPVNELSLGQKVVAMLSFVLGYSEYSHDYRPLIIDQPEDNLDNQYIFKNLVKHLRDIKEKRQIIIATHNATIVTNAKADQVCVMKSNDKHGWIETTGYPGEKKIKSHIVNYLEGGKESFKHKMDVYEAVLRE